MLASDFLLRSEVSVLSVFTCAPIILFSCFLFSSAFLLTVIFRPNVWLSEALRVTLHHVRCNQRSSGPSERYIEQHRAQDDSLASSGGSTARRTERRVTFCCSATCVTRYPNKPGVRWATHRYALRTSGLKITVRCQKLRARSCIESYGAPIIDALRLCASRGSASRQFPKANSRSGKAF